MTGVAEHEHVTAHGAPPTGIRRWTAGGWLRVLWVVPVTFVLSAVLTLGARRLLGFESAGLESLVPNADFMQYGPDELQVLVTVWLVVVPLTFLAAIGGFDYWAYWISGRPARPEDHSGHGARSWRDYFRVNTDHKVIGVQYVVTTFVFFVAAGLMAMFMRAELARSGMQFVDSNEFNGLFSVHATLMIFLFVIP